MSDRERTQLNIAGPTHSANRARRGFTLLELLVVVSIIALLCAILFGSLSRVRAGARSVICMNNLRNVAFDFIRFADDFHHPSRGDSEQYGPKFFRLEDFQERVYRIDEFWDAPGNTAACRPQDQPLMCPASSAPLERRRGLACSQYAVTPTRNVTIGFNMRLDQISVVSGGWPRLRRIRLTSKILGHPSVPLAFDVDGAQADELGVLPYYSAPPAGDTGLYSSGRFWFPATRHNGKLNAAFIGGHVLNSAEPEKAGQWQWSYQPPEN